MARIRTLKPEHRRHRKVGKLSHLTYRLWVGLILEADDYGRLVCDPSEMRAAVFPYHPKVTVELVTSGLRELETAGLIVLYEVAGVPYAWFQSWADHQKIAHPANSRHPEPPALATPVNLLKYSEDNTSRTLANPHEPSRIFSDDQGTGIKDQGSRINTPCPVERDASANGNGQWGKPQDLCDLYNRLAPPGLPRVTRVSTGRRAKVAKYLREFPEREFWVSCFSELKFSQLLLGLAASPGHENFRGDLDWLLSKGKDGTENCVKVVDGKYRDKEYR